MPVSTWLKKGMVLWAKDMVKTITDGVKQMWGIVTALVLTLAIKDSLLSSSSQSYDLSQEERSLLSEGSKNYVC